MSSSDATTLLTVPDLRALLYVSLPSSVTDGIIRVILEVAFSRCRQSAVISRDGSAAEAARWPEGDGGKCGGIGEAVNGKRNRKERKAKDRKVWHL